MNTTFVHVFVKNEAIDNFIQATTENASNSIHEKGVVRFDFFQQEEDPTHFILVEIFKSKEDANLHKETPHYKKWRDVVSSMMSEPRKGIKYKNIYPNDENWK